MWWTNARQIAVWYKLEDGTYAYHHCVERGLPAEGLFDSMVRSGQ